MPSAADLRAFAARLVLSCSLLALVPTSAASLSSVSAYALVQPPANMQPQSSPPKELGRVSSGEIQFVEATGLSTISLGNAQTYERASEVASISIDGRDRPIYYHPDNKAIGFAFKLELREAKSTQGFFEILANPGERYTFTPQNAQAKSDLRLRLSVYLMQLREIQGAGFALKPHTVYTAEATSSAGSAKTLFQLAASQIGTPATAALPCKLASPSNLSVKLPVLASDSLPSLGSSAGVTPFQLSYDCSSASSARLRLDATQIANHPSVLANQLDNGRAQGVGVQLLRNFGERTPLPLNTSADLGFTLQNGKRQQISLLARYYRFATLVPGSVAANLVFTLEYP